MRRPKAFQSKIEWIEYARALKLENQRLRETLDEATGWDWLTCPCDIPMDLVEKVSAALEASDEEAQDK